VTYTPFLKFKVNEISALKQLGSVQKSQLTPFFDFPRKKDANGEDYKLIIDKAYRKYELNLDGFGSFYLDDFDIGENVEINGSSVYSYIIEKFQHVNYIPVVGTDRNAQRNDIVKNSKINEIIISDAIAIRIGIDECLSYSLVEDDFEDLIGGLTPLFGTIILIIDNRICHNLIVKDTADRIVRFLSLANESKSFSKVIITGSSMTASIKDIVNPQDEVIIDRNELEIYYDVLKSISGVELGDYTVVSPNYSDIDIKGEYMRKITTPKLVYPFGSKFNIKRGGSLDSHPRGNKQYNDLCLSLINESYYRKRNYSFGDAFVDDKANGIGNDVTPSTIPKALINAHITFMLEHH
jgi:hypothetical protein